MSFTASFRIVDLSVDPALVHGHANSSQIRRKACHGAHIWCLKQERRLCNEPLLSPKTTTKMMILLFTIFILFDSTLLPCNAAIFPPTIGWRHHRKCHGLINKRPLWIIAVNGGGISSPREAATANPHGYRRRFGSTKSFQQQIQSLMAVYNQWRIGDVLRPCTVALQHVLYWITAADAVHSLFLNEYSGIYKLLYASSTITERTHALVPSVYSKLFYFARLRPRLLYAIGALVRALQLCTPLRKILDPSIGVGAGINLCALLAGSRWVKPFILGWATTKWLWTWLGARQVDRAFLPITLSIHEWEDKKKGLKKNKGGGSNKLVPDSE